MASHHRCYSRKNDYYLSRCYNRGGSRWKIENQGFNRQKHWQGNIEHACSWNEKAQKNHYLMEQIADFIKQLYEYYYLKENEIQKYILIAKILLINLSFQSIINFLQRLYYMIV